MACCQLEMLPRASVSGGLTGLGRKGMADRPGGQAPPPPPELSDAWTMLCGPWPQVNKDPLAQGIPRTRRSPPRSQRQGTRPLWALFITWDF